MGLEVGPLLGRGLADVGHEFGRVPGDIVPTGHGLAVSGEDENPVVGARQIACGEDMFVGVVKDEGGDGDEVAAISATDSPS
jgi:hypothetical protein